jgi:hypothetical protein
MKNQGYNDVAKKVENKCEVLVNKMELLRKYVVEKEIKT